MGNLPSNVSQEELEKIKADFNFSEEELKRIYRRFKKLDSNNSGTISLDEFSSVSELANNPLLQRIISVFDTNKDNEIQFTEFLSALSIFVTKGNTHEKLKFAFNVYDMNGDGYISNGELFQVLKMMVGTNLNDTQLQQIVDKTVLQADIDKDGLISFDEFVKMIHNVEDLEDKLTITLD